MLDILIISLFIPLMVLCAATMFVKPIDQNCDEWQVVKKYCRDLIAGAAMSDEEREEMLLHLDKVKKQHRLGALSRWMVVLLKHCPSTDWRIISYRVKKSQEAFDKLRKNQRLSSQVSERAEISFRFGDSMMYALRKEKLA